MPTTISRRRLLRGMGGAAIALPALDAFLPRHARADTSLFPKRMVLFHFGNGAPMRDWTPATASAGWTLTPILEALGPMAARVDVVTGLAVTGIMQGLSANVHGLRLLASTTGVPGANTGGNVTGAGGPSFDQVAAATLGGATPFSSLVVATATRNDNPLEGRLSWAGVNSPVAPMVDPRELFDLLFAAFDPSQAAEAAERAAERRSVLDYVTTSIEAVRRELGSADGARLDAHLDAVRELEKSLDLGSLSCSAPAAPGSDGGDLELRSDLQLQLIANALACDLTRVVSFSLGPTGGGPVYDFLGLDQGDHDVSHGDYLHDEGARQAYITMTRWKLSRFARLIELLDGMPEGDGSLLDNCVVACMSELSDGNGHSPEFLPVLAGGGIGSGRHLVYPCKDEPILDAMLGTGPHCSAQSSTPLSRLWLSMLRGVGADADDFGNAGGQTLDGLWIG